MTKKKLYISLPITDVKLEIAKSQAEYFASMFHYEYDVITPFDVCPEPGKRISYYMGRDIEALLECDAIFMAPGWEYSTGCMVEQYTATKYRKEFIDATIVASANCNK